MTLMLLGHLRKTLKSNQTIWNGYATSQKIKTIWQMQKIQAGKQIEKRRQQTQRRKQ